MSILSKFKLLLKKESKKNNQYKISEHHNGYLKIVNAMLREPNLIKSICQIQSPILKIDKGDIQLIESINIKYNCNLLPLLYKQTNPLEIYSCRKQGLYFIENGYRFNFDGKELDIMIDTNGNIVLGDPKGADQYILDRKRGYKGSIIITSNSCVAISAIYDCVESQLLQSLMGEDFNTDYQYEINLDDNTFSRFKKNEN